MAGEIVVPPLGESVTEATVAKWHKKEGDSVNLNDLLVELETDKVTLEVNASVAGALKNIKVKEGSTVKVGELLGNIEAGAKGVASSAPAPAAAGRPAPAPSAPVSAVATAAVPAPRPAPMATAASSPSEHLSPAVRKMIVENNVPPSAIPGSGKGGRITKGDVMGVLERGFTGSANSGPREERVKMTRLRQRIAERLKESQNTAAILTTFNEVDMTNVIDLRNTYKEAFEKKHGVKLGFMSFFVKAAVNALKEIPAVNAEIDGDEIVYKNYYDIGVAVGTDQGLVVPVVRDCDGKSFADIEKEIGALGKKARDGKLSMAELTGGTFTVTNGGVYGSLMSTPIINPPQSGILGMHKTMKRAMVMPDGSIKARDMMYIALSYDHRMIDGKEAVTFLVRVKEAMEDPQRMLLSL